MRRPWHIWIAFALCLVVVLTAMGWISLATLRLDRAEVEARHQAALEENVRLALWRLDSTLAPLLAQESARPYFSYGALFPADLANGRIFNRNPEGGKTAHAPPPITLVPGSEGGLLPAGMLVPSPLLKQTSPHILVHFQFEPDGRLTSPQVPSEANFKLAVPEHVDLPTVERARKRLAKAGALVARDKLIEMLPASTPAPVAVVFSPSARAELSQSLQQVAESDADAQFLNEPGPQGGPQQVKRAQLEYQQRSRVVQQQANTMAQNLSFNNNDLSWASTDVTGVLMTPLWIDGNLVLARRVTAGGKEYVQGCLLDWPEIRGELLKIIADLLPGAHLEPVVGRVLPDTETRMLAALPLRLVPGAAVPGNDGSLSPIRLSLAVAWACVLLAASAVGILVLGVMRLSERRAAFVSAVTHELRTPLTTFRMYAEMLGEGMVPKDQERQYLETLQAEASRLTHLVENVLSYARLERGRTSGRVEDVPLDLLLEQVAGRLADRARQAGMELIVEPDEAALAATVRANPSAVEQILFNLVDNACKYAAGAGDRRIHFEARRTDGRVQLRVRDHGPGIARTASRRLFRSFAKSAHEAANSAPGVGLGLALSRRLAQDMGARLRLDRSVTDGAALALTLAIVAGV
jgi:signal transduction histidine kinase